MAKYKYFSVDVEADGPCAGLNSMVSFGAVEIDSGKTFYAELRPITKAWVPEALAVSGFTREQTMKFGEPADVMKNFASWIYEMSGSTQPKMIADNPYFDASYINYYFHKFTGSNPFGWSCVSLTSLYAGLEGSMFKSFKHLRVTPHDHNALSDAQGNAEAVRVLRKRVKGL